MKMKAIRAVLESHFESLRCHSGGRGSFASGPGGPADFYVSMDIVHARTVMGEDLRTTLEPVERKEWAEHIGSFQNPDGSFRGIYGKHSGLHALGMVIGALGVLGHPLPHRHTLHEDLRNIDQIEAWLEAIDWENQWSASHAFWGGMHCYSFSSHCTPEWKRRVLAWLDAHLDEKNGWWCRGIPCSDRHQALGGSAHIVPIYQHHDHPFPYPERLIDSILELQLEAGNWLAIPGYYPVSYLDLDALYLLKYASEQVPDYRREAILRATGIFGDYTLACWETKRSTLLGEHPHHLLGFVGALGLLQQHLPDRFVDSRQWSDIFSDRRLYQANVVCPVL